MKVEFNIGKERRTGNVVRENPATVYVQTEGKNGEKRTIARHRTKHNVVAVNENVLDMDSQSVLS